MELHARDRAVIPHLLTAAAHLTLGLWWPARSSLITPLDLGFDRPIIVHTREFRIQACTSVEAVGSKAAQTQRQEKG
ncbi:hypothetical protein BDU57DRAFT_514671 [Ampelomyces quisqualis]|uniref:Uncharacterized protein n=1 Tax=Ampelomyces quisqualis TaxID=50730 RepID=A0A6A5QTB9_AMPQU|nr:hypothetical protein BDU57DRAFT_514671 [Ampelomyces quisqualis]